MKKKYKQALPSLICRPLPYAQKVLKKPCTVSEGD